jgi:DNA-binding NtrC family response regulator
VGEGTGLGLAVVLGIMQSHDGAVTVYSEPGKGATFHLYFPVFHSDAAPPKTDLPPVPHGQGEHILFIDDEIALANVAQRMLERLGYKVTAKTNALEAIAAVRQEPGRYQVVITDLTMPGLDGIKLGKQLLEIDSRLPIILTTGYSGVTTEESLRELGFKGLLTKPATARMLAEAIHRALQPDKTNHEDKPQEGS